jgi:hypothetical protein
MPLASSKCRDIIVTHSPVVWGAALFFMVVALERLTCTTPDVDLWGYMAFGRLFWETGSFPYRDIFAYLPTIDPFIYHEWLTGVLLYPIYTYTGAAGVQFLKYCLGLSAVGLVYLTARLRGAEPLPAICGLFLVQSFLALGYSPVRAQAFTIAFFGLSLYLLERARKTGHWRQLWVLIPVQVVWANLHGGFVAGLGLVALYALGELISRRPFLPYIKVLLVAVPATLINPYGLEYWHYLAAALAMPRPEITEWVSAYQAYQRGVFFKEFLIFFLVAFSALAIIIRTHWWQPTPILLLALTFFLGFRHLRHQVFFFLLIGAYLPGPLTYYFQAMRTDPKLQALKNIGRRLGWQMPAFAVATVVVYYSYLIVGQEPLRFRLPPIPSQGKTSVHYPTGAVAYIQARGLSGNMLTEFNWGEYLIWSLYPRCRVSLDGRFEAVYASTVYQEYFDFLYARPRWRQFLEKYPPDLILIDRRNKIYTLIKAEPSWQQVYQDAGSALFLRRSSSNLNQAFERSPGAGTGEECHIASK